MDFLAKSCYSSVGNIILRALELEIVSKFGKNEGIHPKLHRKYLSYVARFEGSAKETSSLCASKAI